MTNKRQKGNAKKAAAARCLRIFL